MTDRRPPHLVLLTAHYPPATAAGARRPHNLAHAFRVAGWEVSVVTCGETSAPEVGVFGEAIHRTPVPPLAARVESGVGASRGSTGQHGPIAAARRHYRAVRGFPDIWRTAGPGLVRAARTSIARGGHQLLLSTAPPISVHRAALRLRAHVPSIVPWVAEFRDPWTEPGGDNIRWSGSVVAPMARHLMRRVARSASRYVAVSGGIGRWLIDQGVENPLVALNGIPDELLDRPSGPPELGVLRYVGEFYLSRDPGPLFASLGRLKSAGTLPAQFRMELIGDVERAVGCSTRELLATAGLLDLTTLTPRIDHAAAVERIRGAGLLLLLAQNQPDQIPNKLYEYLGARRPILAVVDHDGESHRLLRQGGHDALVLTERSTPADWDRVVADAVAAAFLPPDRAPTPEPDPLDELRTSRQLSRVVAACEELLDRP